MRSAAVLALLLCAGQAIALPVNSLMNKGDTEVMKCIVEVISDTLSKPSPMPVSQECFETLQGDERILSILRHQNLLKELQDLALQGAKERAHQQKEHGGFENEFSEVLENESDKAEQKEVPGEASPKEAVEKRDHSNEAENHGDITEGARPRASLAPREGSEMENTPAPGGEEDINTHPPASLPGQKHAGPESPARDLVGTEKGLDTEKGQPAKSPEEDEELETGEKADSEEESPTSAVNPHTSLSYKETPRGKSRTEVLTTERTRKTGAEEAPPPKKQGEQEYSQESEETVGTPEGLFRGWKSGEQEEPIPKEWEGAKRWSKMEQLAKELTAEKRQAREDMKEEEDPDRSMKLSFRTRAYGLRAPGSQVRRGWRPSSEEDSVEAGLPVPGRGYSEEKKEEEGSANRRPEDQELESLSAIEAELEKVAHQLQALRRG
ncbi:PREDICTED: chromogranin-A [Chrysochloris asiatica]|uniref:Chromogranin-A n=1 Tax=Chrysochloris asiatica TaxID=185453 RepID=A0A9B0WKV4_CHRAS|nr:PREDICTED: chromogranin-A [Chrysochloris asiatica]